MALIRYHDGPTHDERISLKKTAPPEMHNEIDNCTCYKHFQQLTFKAEAMQPSFDQIPNPSQTDIKKHLKRFIS
jgi:hypothetical protein